jgi:stage IV sporulation protein B
LKWFSLKRLLFVKIALILIFFATFLFTQPHLSLSATNYTLLPGGETIGIRLDTGVYVAGKYQVETQSGKMMPWKNSNIEPGDRIMVFDGKPVRSNQDLINYLQICERNSVELIIERNGVVHTTMIMVYTTTRQEKSIGLYIKDRILGIGTLTFIDPATKKFGALGHGVFDATISLGKVTGTVLSSSVESVKRAIPGTPGEKRAVLKKEEWGKFSLNSVTGLFGIMHQPSILSKKPMEVATQDEVHQGKAYFMTVIEGGRVEKFSLEIISVKRQEETDVKGIKVKITDEKLIEATGGIVQGMSGSPIIQDGKIVGAISHVTVDNPLVGYAIHIEWMLKELAQIDII